MRKFYLFIRHLAGHIWRPYKDLDGTLRHFEREYCCDIKYPTLEDYKI